MKLRRALILAAIAVAVSSVVEGSILLKHSLLKPREETCFTCRSEDRPFAYPLVSFFVKMKDMFVKGLNVVMDSAKSYKLDKLDSILKN